MQRLAALQSLDLLFTNVAQRDDVVVSTDTPHVVYGVFATENSYLETSESGYQRKSSGNNRAAAAEPVPTKKKEVMIAVRALSSFDDILRDVSESKMVTFPVDERIISQYLSGEIMSGKEYLQFLSAEVKEVAEESVSQRCAHRSVVLSSLQLLLELGPSLLRLYSANYNLTFIGHGYGGAVASLTSLLLQSAMLSTQAVKAVAYGPIPFIDFTTAEEMKPFVLTVALHDDIVPRLTKESCKGLVADLLYFKTKIFSQSNQSWDYIVDQYLSQEQQPSIQGEPVKESEQSDLVVSTNPPSIQSLKTFLAGRIVHFYFHRGQYRPSYVDRTFPSLRKIEFQDHLLKDHRSNSLLNALLEARAAKVASSTPSKWIPFDGSANCSCCKQRFSWISSFNDVGGDGKDIYRQKFNCRSCGSLVCGDCARNYRSIGKYGMVFPRRICDKCVLTGEFVTA